MASRKPKPTALTDHAPLDVAPARVREVAAAAFKAGCLRMMDDVSTGKAQYVITKHRRPIARLVPYETHQAPLFGALKGSATFVGDITSPVGESWHADGEGDAEGDLMGDGDGAR